MTMKMISLFSLAALAASAACLTILFVLAAPLQPVLAAPASKAEIMPEPVEDDMHEFMEYVFQPGYKRLKVAMAMESPDNAVWKTIKAESLVLAEGGNLLLLRTPDEDADAWREYSAAVRGLGADVYHAAKKKDVAATRKSYEAMLVQCNQCHQKFADGEHQLQP